jgi:hypothetical protein
MLAQSRGKVGPLDLGHYSPNVIRANSSLIFVFSAGSVEEVKRSAKAKK